MLAALGPKIWLEEGKNALDTKFVVILCYHIRALRTSLYLQGKQFYLQMDNPGRIKS